MSCEQQGHIGDPGRVENRWRRQRWRCHRVQTTGDPATVRFSVLDVFRKEQNEIVPQQLVACYQSVFYSNKTPVEAETRVADMAFSAPCTKCCVVCTTRKIASLCTLCNRGKPNWIPNHACGLAQKFNNHYTLLCPGLRTQSKCRCARVKRSYSLRVQCNICKVVY